MRSKKMLGRALGVESAVVESERPSDTGLGIVVHIRIRAADRDRCPICLAACPGYDNGAGPRRWRTHDIGLARAFLEADGGRVECPTHGVHGAHVPWARPHSGFTRSFEDEIAWFCVRTDKTTVSTRYGIAWRTVGAILERVAGSRAASPARLDGVTRIGIDEVSYRKGHRYLTCVVDHDTGRLLWAHPGRDGKTLRKFFRKMGKRRCRKIQLVSADAAPWIAKVVKELCPHAKLCIDPFHVVAWATKALDNVRRKLWNKLRKSSESDEAAGVKGSRWVLLKRPERLNPKQRGLLAEIKKLNQPLYAAYLLKEQLREVFQNRDWQGALMLDAWVQMAKRSRIPEFVKVAKTIARNARGIHSALIQRLSNARLESLNTKLKLLTRMAYGFHSHKPLVALAMLKYGGLCPPLPRLT